MKPSTKILVGLGAAAALTSAAFVGSAWTDEREGGVVRGQDRGLMQLAQAGGAHGRMHRTRFGPRHGHRDGRFGERIFEQFDADKDGKVDQAEIDKARADRLARFDADQDGKLNLKEYEALWLDAMRERMVDAFQRHDDDGDAQVTVEEFQKRFKNMVSRLDHNGDGVFSRDDIQQRRQEMRERRREREHRGRRDQL